MSNRHIRIKIHWNHFDRYPRNLLRIMLNAVYTILRFKFYELRSGEVFNLGSCKLNAGMTIIPLILMSRTKNPCERWLRRI